MQQVDIALTDSTRLEYPTWRGSATFGTGSHGDEAASLFAPLTRYQAMQLYDRLSAALTVTATAGGRRIWQGRVEDISINDAGVQINALGKWRAFRDAPWTAFWSDTRLDRWRELTTQDRGNRLNGRFTFDQQDRLLIAPNQGATFDQNVIGSFGYEVPSRSDRNITGLMCRIDHNLPTATWVVQIARFTGGFGGARTVVATINGTGALAQYPVFTTFAASDAIEISVIYSSGVPVVYAGETGDSYGQVTDVRMVSATNNTINTTLSANVTAGTGVTATVGSTAGMYAGQWLAINPNNALGEMIEVTSVLSATQFVATFAKNHLAGVSVRAFLVYGDAIVSTARTFINSVNPGTFNTSDAQLQSPGIDLLDEVFEDADIGDELTRIAGYGDTSGQRYEVGVSGDMVYFRPEGSRAQAWYIDAADLEVQQTLENLLNSTYGVYQSQSGRTLRTAPVADATSVTRYGVTRRAPVSADTTVGNVAATIAALARTDGANPPPRATMTVRRVFSASGVQAPGYLVRAGDTLTIRNLPPVAGETIDKIRTFRLAETDYDAATGVLSVVPETPPAELEYQLARLPIVGGLGM